MGITRFASHKSNEEAAPHELEMYSSPMCIITIPEDKESTELIPTIKFIREHIHLDLGVARDLVEAFIKPTNTFSVQPRLKVFLHTITSNWEEKNHTQLTDIEPVDLAEIINPYFSLSRNKTHRVLKILTPTMSIYHKLCNRDVHLGNNVEVYYTNPELGSYEEVHEKSIETEMELG